MKKFLFSVLLFLTMVACNRSANIASEDALPRAIDTTLTADFDQVFRDVNAVSSSDLHSLMVVKDGEVIYEKYAVGHSEDELHICWSATKSFTALAVGFALQDGLISLDEPVIKYLPAEAIPAEVSPELATLTLDHLLKMASGFRFDSISSRIRGGETFDPLKEILARGFVAEPGTHWAYNNSDTYVVAAAIAHVTGRPLEVYLNEKLFRPIGIRSFYFEKDAMCRNPGAFGLHLSTESLAKAGLFMMQHGQWKGQQLLSSDYIDCMMATHIMQGPINPDAEPSDWRSGYCYQMWTCKQNGCTRFDGMWGQYVILMPDKNAVGVMTTLCTDRTVQMDSFWKNVYNKL